MDEGPEPDIDTIEERIEALTAETLRCRKFALVARLLIGAGIVALGLMLIGIVSARPEILVGALAALIGGVVLLGSNASTWDQAEAALRAAESLRNEMIARMRLRIVGEDRPTLH
jgi:hypothetical protein